MSRHSSAAWRPASRCSCAAGWCKGRARDEQARAIGIWAAVGSAALPAGPLLGGALVQTLGWRPVFLLNVPIVLAAAAVAARVAPTGAPPGSRRLDRAGVLLAGLLLASLTFAFIQAGHGGLGIPVLVAGVLALAFLVAFCLVERAVPDPILPPRLFRRPAFCAANAVAASMNLGTLGLLFVLTLYLQSVQGRSPLAAGVAVLPLFLPLVVLAPLSGRATARYGPRLPMTVGLLVAAGGVALMSAWAAGTAYLSLLPVLLAWGVGMGLLTPAVVTAAVGAVDADRAGLASGVNNTARQAGGAIGIAVYGATTGPATDRGAFLAGLHLTGLLTSGLFVVAAAATVSFLGSADRSGPVRPERRS